jgi:hypothetical protein
MSGNLTKYIAGVCGLALAISVAGAAEKVLAPKIGQVTKAAIVVQPAHYNGQAPAHIKFIGTIFVSNAPVTVKYHFERSDGASSASREITIASGAGAEVDDTWDIGAAGVKETVWERLVTDAPNTKASPKGVAHLVFTK